MSQKEHGNTQHRLKGVKLQSGGFICNGTSDPLTVYGAGFTATYSAVNQIKITFDGPYKTILSVTGGITDAAVPLQLSFDGLTDGPDDPASFLINIWSQDAITGIFTVGAPPAVGDEVRVSFMVEFLDLGAQ
jgi:hypothetical protein